MWFRKDLKTNAKSALKGRYWTAVLISVIAGILTGNTMGGINIPSGKGLESGPERFERIKEFFTQYSEYIIPVMAVAVLAGLFFMCIAIAYMMFIANPIRVGRNRFFLENRKGKTETGRMLSVFGTGYRNVVKVMFLKNLYIFLWSLLFIIPGIIKFFEYFAVDYIMAENPGMDIKRALKLSGSITLGEKWKIFVLMLSFIGWILLCLPTLGIGYVFLMPYIQATLAELYTELRLKALAKNYASHDELPGI